MEITEILTSQFATLIVSAVLILTQLVKTLVADRYIPLVGFGIGFIMTFVIFGFNTSVILPAILIAGAGLGLYDVGKKTVLGK